MQRRGEWSAAFRQEHLGQKQGKEAKTSHRDHNSNREADSKMVVEGSQKDNKETEVSEHLQMSE